MTKVHIPNNDSHLDEAYNLTTDDEAEEFYNTWATDYDDHYIKNLNYNAFEHVANDLASVLPRRDARILDVGTGTGLTGQALANLGFKNIDGWDISEKMLKEAMIKKVYRNLLTINLNESKYPVMSRYDAAVSSGTFTKGHVKHDALPYIIEILKPGGYFACTINIGIWEELGFKYTIEQLEKDNIISIEKYTDRSYWSDDTLECRCFLFKKL